jgi:hypothetical protein
MWFMFLLSSVAAPFDDWRRNWKHFKEVVGLFEGGVHGCRQLWYQFPGWLGCEHEGHFVGGGFSHCKGIILPFKHFFSALILSFLLGFYVLWKGG